MYTIGTWSVGQCTHYVHFPPPSADCARVSLTQEAKLDAEWNVRACPAAIESSNPIRELLESLSVVSSKRKEKISLAQGDPTAFGHLKVPQAAVEAMVAATKSFMCNGYTHSAGSHDCRK
jgi:hypothetical protein